MIQDKAQSADNGRSLLRAVTPYWIICLAPFGRAGKRSFAAFRLLARIGPLPARRALRPTASRLAEPVNITLKEYSDSARDRPTCFASYTLIPESFVQYAG